MCVVWGRGGVLEDKRGRLSVIDLSGETAALEILADEPAAGVKYVPRVDGFVLRSEGRDLYAYNPQERLLSSISLELPECQNTTQGIRVGGGQFIGNVFAGFGVGIVVTSTGLAM